MTQFLDVSDESFFFFLEQGVDRLADAINVPKLGRPTQNRRSVSSQSTLPQPRNGEMHLSYTRRLPETYLQSRRVHLYHCCDVARTQERNFRGLLTPAAPVRVATHTNPEIPGFVLSAAGLIISGGPDPPGSVVRLWMA